jgi:hypothetical protein
MPSPKGSESIVGIPEKRGKKNVYMHLGHAGDLVETLPVPKGCVYVTFTLCGEISKDSYRILKAFEDPAIRDLLKDPVKHIVRLTEYFGSSLHVHYPEAEDPTSRTYFNTKYKPFLSHDVKDHPICFAKKSGLYRLGDLATYKVPAALISSEAHADIRPYTASFPCDDLQESALKYVYKGSLYPTMEQILTEFDSAEKSLTFQKMNQIMKKYKYTQAWAFEKYPGVHYNFVCRGHAHKEENIKNSPILRRRRNSLNAAKKLMSKRTTRRA